LPCNSKTQPKKIQASGWVKGPGGNTWFMRCIIGDIQDLLRKNINVFMTSSAAQGGGGKSKDKKPIGETWLL
jgi:hypothetical protein